MGTCKYVKKPYKNYYGKVEYKKKKECKTVKTCQKVPEEECKYVKKPHTDHYGKVQYKTEEICTTTYKDECHEEEQCETEKPSYSNTYYGRKKRSASTYDTPKGYGK